MDFRKVIYENVKKNPFISQHTYLYVWVTDILKFYKFYFDHIVKVCFVFKKQSYVYILPYMYKTLPTLENEKEQQQIKFYKKSSWELIFLLVAVNFKNVLFHLPDWASAQKVRLHHWN